MGPRIATGRSALGWGGLLAVAAVMLFSMQGCGLLGAGARAGDARAAAPAAGGAGIQGEQRSGPLAETYTCRFLGASMPDAVDHLRRTTSLDYALCGLEVPTYWSWGAGRYSRQVPLTVTLKMSAPLGDVLDRICGLSGLAWRADNNTVTIGAPMRVSPFEMRIYDVRDLLEPVGRISGRVSPPDYSQEELIQDFIGLIEKACLPDTWEHWAAGGTRTEDDFRLYSSSEQEKSRLPRGRAVRVANRPGFIAVHHVRRVHEAIDDLLGKLRGFRSAGAPDSFPSLRETPAEPSPEEARARAALAEKCSVILKRASLGEGLEKLMGSTTIDYALYDQDSWVRDVSVTMDFTGPLSEGLDEIGRRARVKWRLDGDVLVVGEAKWLADYETRIYNVSDLVQYFDELASGNHDWWAEDGGPWPPGAVTENLILLAKQACRPDMWVFVPSISLVLRDDPQPSVWALFPEADPKAFFREADPGVLIVRQSHEVHACIEDLFRMLRESVGQETDQSTPMDGGP